DHMEQRMFAQLGYRKKKWGMSSNEEFMLLFIVEFNLEAKETKWTGLGHVLQLGDEVEKLSCDASKLGTSMEVLEGF
ncbi:hypothetical protein Tco_0509505, partial [Tanacetum coccineum]